MYTKASQLQKVKIKRVVVKSVPDLKKSVQRVFNKYIRLRDQYKPCISCQKRVESGDCGHYIAQGSSGLLRYTEENCNLQCTACNRFKHGNLIEYRMGLIIKIGEENVRLLEDARHLTKKWTREELEELLTTYKEKIKKYEK